MPRGSRPAHVCPPSPLATSLPRERGAPRTLHHAPVPVVALHVFLQFAGLLPGSRVHCTHARVRDTSEMESQGLGARVGPFTLMENQGRNRRVSAHGNPGGWRDRKG